jgi:hypothetical protein
MTAPIPNVIGIVIGIPVTLIGNHPIQNMLYGLKGTDLISLAVSVILLLGIAILAGYSDCQAAALIGRQRIVLDDLRQSPYSLDPLLKPFGLGRTQNLP